MFGMSQIFRRGGRMPPPPPTNPQPQSGDDGIDVERLLAAARKGATVELSAIEWNGDAETVPLATDTRADAAAGEELTNAYDARCRRIRDRYIGARFPGVARAATDLENAARVVKAARLYFEDGQADTALELLDMAIEQDSRAEALWLAQLEILFLTRNASRYIETARAFRAMLPASEAWDEIARLGRTLAPREGLFGTAGAARDHEHYGPWPDLPNWIQANWDLTAEVLAADFHRILKQRVAA